MSSSDVAAEITGLVEKMHARKPPNTRITADVCITVFKQKYAAAFAGRVTDWAEHRELIAGVLARLDAAAAPKPAAAPAPKKKAESSDDESDDDSDDDDDDGDSEEDSDYDSEAGEDEEDSDESEEESDEESESAVSSQASKRHRAEAAAPAATADVPVDDKHTLEMARFAKKCGLRPPSLEPNEAMAAYRTRLNAFFAANSMDPNDLSKDQKKRLAMRQELAVLQQEVDITLDKRSRKGRAQFNVPGEDNATSDRFQVKGLYDDEE